MKIKETPLLSIVMATYNGEKFLSQQLDSIINQYYTNIELIIGDDCSTDNTLNIIKAYQEKHEFIKLYKNTSRLGFVKNFEKAISLSTGDYIALSDQDDIWHPDKLTTNMEKILQKELICPNSPIMVHSDLELIDEKNNLLGASYFKLKHYNLKENKDLGHILGPCGVMGNTILFNQYLKKKILPFPEDLEFHDYWIALVNELIGTRVTVNQPLLKYRLHTKNTSNTYHKLNEDSAIYQIKSVFQRSKTKLPFISTKRMHIIDYIKKNFTIKEEDVIILEFFQIYLMQKGSKIKHIFYLFKYSLLKRSILYRINFIIKYLIYKNES